MQDILEAILEKKGVTHQDIMEEFRKRKEEIDIQNKKKWSEALGINRTSIYCKYTPVKKVKIDSLKKHWNSDLIDWINQKVIDSDYTIGIDKLYNQYIQTINYVSSYVFRLHFESTGYK